MKSVGWTVLVMAMAVAAQADDRPAGGGEGGRMGGHGPRMGGPGNEGQPMAVIGGGDREEILKKFDKDGDGKLSQEERQAMREDRKAEIEARHADMIKKFDKDGDGKLSDEERAAMPQRPMRPGRGGGHEGRPPRPQGEQGGGEMPPPPPPAQ